MTRNDAIRAFETNVLPIVLATQHPTDDAIREAWSLAIEALILDKLVSRYSASQWSNPYFDDSRLEKGKRLAWRIVRARCIQLLGLSAEGATADEKYPDGTGRMLDRLRQSGIAFSQ